MDSDLMPVTLNGSTSGQVTLTAPAVAGTNTITLPAATGTILVPTSSGTTGQLLTSAGTGAAPTWATNTAMSPISIGGSSNTAGNVFTSLPSTYSTYWISFTSGLATTGTIYLALSSNNGSSYGADITIGSSTSANRTITGFLKITNVNASGSSKVVTGYSTDTLGNLVTINSTEAVITGVINAIKIYPSTTTISIASIIHGVP